MMTHSEFSEVTKLVAGKEAAYCMFSEVREGIKPLNRSRDVVDVRNDGPNARYDRFENGTRGVWLDHAQVSCGSLLTLQLQAVYSLVFASKSVRARVRDGKEDTCRHRSPLVMARTLRH